MTKRLADREWTVLIWRDADGYLVAEVPELQGCYTQARSWDELMARIEEVISLCLEDAETRLLRRTLSFSCKVSMQM